MIIKKHSLAKACSSIPSGCKGIYTLILRVDDEALVEVGSLGALEISKGFYAYIGSGKGPGGVRARLCRHIHGCGKKHWHIDYLHGIAKPVGFTYCCSEDRDEYWLYKLYKEVFTPRFRGFGSSDDRRAFSHLFKCGDSIDECVEGLSRQLDADTCFNSKIILLL